MAISQIRRMVTAVPLDTSGAEREANNKTTMEQQRNLKQERKKEMYGYGTSERNATTKAREPKSESTLQAHNKGIINT